MLQHHEQPSPRGNGSGKGYRTTSGNGAQLRQLEDELGQKDEQIHQMQVTLKNVMQTIDQSKDDFRTELAHHMRTELLPALEKIVREDSRDIRNCYKEVIQDQLASLTEGSSARLDKDLLRLTPTEIQVCQYIQSGQGTKQIAEMMHSAFETVQTHRKNIRRKLGLKGKRVTLYSYLKTKAFSNQEESMEASPAG